MQWVQPSSVGDVRWSWQGGWVGRRRQKVWFFASHCLMWTIWLERNRRTFRDVVVPVSRLKSWFLSILLSWVSGRVDPDLFSFLDSLDELSG